MYQFSYICSFDLHTFSSIPNTHIFTWLKEYSTSLFFKKIFPSSRLLRSIMSRSDQISIYLVLKVGESCLGFNKSADGRKKGGSFASFAERIVSKSDRNQSTMGWPPNTRYCIWKFLGKDFLKRKMRAFNEIVNPTSAYLVCLSEMCKSVRPHTRKIKFIIKSVKSW